ncbi:helix-hairpin-helix domain-containing protein [Reichenbachiella carrageenanivorans]|uniref:Helix-hairpin-helix domain-containing protein n=1 Tax=Reichenbachiella carrageenanivorans TaxID=2979869 RepID=A0ABY6CYG4_9BACT|nr:helix-hairpin-helix domain-containing protein [Reichenbachiella carrageenanivorans]UXX78959.1 helix-hairpin-helix domain-containing protein [Reichenbachiella carrageenanivorans]
MKKLAYIALILYGTTSVAVAQRFNKQDIDIQEFIEDLYQVPDEDINYDDLYESLYQLYSNPINLNETNKNELNSLYQLNIAQINSLMEYLDKNGPMLSIYELQVIDGFDRTTINHLMPFVEVRSPGDHSTKGHLLKRITTEKNNYLILRTESIIEDQNGYIREDSSRYLGSRQKIYGRFRSSHSKDFSVGLTFEKDPGEQIIFDHNTNQYGFDYYSYHLFLYDKGNFKSIAVGDYQMQFGQGLVLGSGFNPGKGAETITTVKRGNAGLRPYTSALETNFMRGAAFTYTIKNLEITPFYSRLKQDGIIRSEDFNGEYEEYITGIQDIGMHRTYSELASRNGITEETAGMNLTYNDLKKKNLQFGATFIHNSFSVPIQKTPNNYNQFEFKGDKNYNMSIFANYNWHNFLLFSEIARSKSGGTAMVGGFMGSLSPIVSMSFLYRNYSKDYHSFYGNSFGEGSRNINEIGLYWGLKVTPSKRTSFAAYYDRFQFPWLRFGVNAPSQGYEYLIRAEYSPTRKIKLYAQLREQAKEVSVSTEGGNLHQLKNGVKRNYIGNLDFAAHDIFLLKSRVQFSTYDLAGEQTQGLAVMQDVNIKINKFTISTRFAIFDTEDYENRQYVFEKNLLYVFSINAYAYQGTRNYIMLQYKPTRKLTLWARYGRFDYRHQDSVGSGMDKIEGNTKSDVKFQIRYKL